MLQIKDLIFPLSDTQNLQIDSVNLNTGESLLVVGDNASGKSALAQLLCGNLEASQGELSLPAKIASLSFELENATLEYDRLQDDSEFLEGGVDMGRTALEIILEDLNTSQESEALNEVVELLGIEDLLPQAFKVLSTGETRKILMAKALIQQADLLILDEPFAGLDIQSQQRLTALLDRLVSRGKSIVLFDFYHPGIPQSIQNLLYLQQGQVRLYGNRAALINSAEWVELNQVKVVLPHHLPDCVNYDHIDPNQALVRLNSISASYLDKPVFKDLSWNFQQGEHWQIMGPNGCGKTTLLSMISGDNTKAYGQDIWLFGVKRGSGESIWEIKRHYGLVSAQLHRDYRMSCSLLHTVLSGFYDSIGLYQQPGLKQIEIAKQWLSLLGLEHLQNNPFNQLSYGEQRLVLIARAVVKLPLVLILDEPCQGLDNHNRQRVLALIDYIASHSDTHILFVSHDARDQLKCLTHQLRFEKTSDDSAYQAKTIALKQASHVAA